MSDEITRDSIIAELDKFAETTDNDVIEYKRRIKEVLLRCPELLYALNWDEYEDELFNEDGTLNEYGEWDKYFGTAIRPYMIFPDTVTDAKTYLCFLVHFDEKPRYNDKLYYYQVSFVILAHSGDILDKDTGIPRHDLIGAIIQEKFNWTNIFGNQCKMVSNTERVTDSNFLTRTIVFEGTMTNGLVNTKNGETRIINHLIRK